MKITIEWNDDLGEARLTPASKRLLEERLTAQAGEREYDVVLADFLIDCTFIIDQARKAILTKKTTFKETT